MLEMVAKVASPQPPIGQIGRGFVLLALLILCLVVVMSALVLGMLARRRSRLRTLSKPGTRSHADDPWKASAQRADVPTAEELYRASGFDQDETRIEDSPDFGDDGPGDSGNDHKRRKPKRPDQF